jgi:PAS domain S-box-containing protein
LHIAGRVAYKFNHKILIQKEDKVLQGIINKVIDSMDEKRKLDIKEKWLQVAVNEVQDYTLLYQIISVFVLFLLGTFYWNRRLTREIRERKKIEQRLESEKENFKLLFEKVSNGNLIIQNGHFINANDAALKMLGIKDIKILLDSSPSKWSPEFQADGSSSNKKSLEYMRECLEKGSSRFEWLHHDVDGKEFWVDVGLTKIQYENSEAIYVVWHDINEQKSLHNKLILAKKSAEAANKSKSEFLANMSHEIRTPMNAIIGFTELLNEQLTEPRLRAYTKTIQSAGNSLLTLINDILDLSKIEAGKLEIKRTPTNLFNLINEISSIFTMSVKNKGLELIVDVSEDIPQSLLIDEVRLRQILFNLIGNAVKFTQEGFIKLSVDIFNVDEHLSKLDVEIRVEDSGIGIPKSQIEKIFKQFEQTDGQDSRKFGGTGLGLSISKRLSEMMGGKISVISKEEGGAIFTVQLFHIDISSIIPQSLESSSEDSETIVFEKAKVLVVDDIENNRELIIKNFENSALEIVTANDGIEALKAFKELSPDLVLMDIRMPNMDGYEAAKEMKKISADIPIIALTASVMQGEHERLQSRDFDGYLRKPVLKQELFKELSRFLAFKALLHEDKSSTQESFELNSKAKESIEEILEHITSLIVPLHRKVIKTNNISDVEKFAKSVSLLAEEYEIAFLKNYSDKLFNAVDVFDILEIQKLTKEFPNLLEKLKA